MLENKENLNNDEELDSVEEQSVDVTETGNNENPEKIREEEIEFRLGEINVIFDEYQNKLYDEDIEILTSEEYNNLVQEQKELKKELKELRKVTRNSFWDQVKVWQIVYGVIQLVICMPYIGLIYQLCMGLYMKLYEWFGDMFINVSPGFAFFIEVLMVLAFPILNIFVSWILYANVVSKKKLDRVMFISIWIGQVILTIISMLFVFIG